MHSLWLKAYLKHVDVLTLPLPLPTISWFVLHRLPLSLYSHPKQNKPTAIFFPRSKSNQGMLIMGLFLPGCANTCHVGGLLCGFAVALLVARRSGYRAPLLPWPFLLALLALMPFGRRFLCLGKVCRHGRSWAVFGIYVRNMLAVNVGPRTRRKRAEEVYNKALQGFTLFYVRLITRYSKNIC